MRSRRLARRLALDVLYEAEIRDELPEEALEERESAGWVVPATEDDVEGAEPGGEPTEDTLRYARVLVRGVQARQADLDVLIASYADRWALTRMPVIDRTLLRMALFELFEQRDIPVPVVINEAVELAKSLSTDDSGRFINGLLGRIVDDEAIRPDGARD